MTQGSWTVPPTRPARYWWTHAAPSLLYMGFLYWLGSDRGSADQTQGLLTRLLRAVAPGLLARIPPQELERVNGVLRKGGHFGGYALLGVLNARALRGWDGRFSRRDGLLAWAATTGCAAVDEWHQSFSPSRGSSAADVALDSAGAVAGILLYRRRTARERAQE